MSPVVETVAVLGSGAMGAMYASHLVAGGVPVTLAARGERAARLRRGGLTVNGAPLDADVFDAATDTPATPADLVVVAVKHHHLDDALDDVAPLVGPDTIFLSVLNGLDSEERIADRFADVLTDPAQVLLCIALAMDAMRDTNAVTFRQAGRLVFGEPRNDPPSERVRAVQVVLDRAGLAWQTPADMRHEMWWKFMVNVGINQASGVHRAPYGDFVDDGEPRRLMLALIDEVIAVAAAEGVTLGQGDLDRWQQVLAAQPVDGKTSMHQDVEAGRTTEVDIFAGHVVALGRRHGIDTPVNASVPDRLR